MATEAASKQTREPGTQSGRKYEFAPITSEDRIVYVPLGGKPIKCLMVDDAVMFLDEPEGWIPDFREHVPNIRKMDMDDDDVIICAFPKSGSHWLSEITNMLLQGKAEYDKKGKANANMEYASVEELRSLSKPRVFNTHFTFPNLPKQVTERNCKLIFIQRNPKDVLVSYLSFFQGYNIIESTVKWEEFIDKYMEIDIDSSILNWFYYTKSWLGVIKRNHGNIHCLTFEDLKEDPVREITKLAQFLEVHENVQLFQDIAEKCSFKNLKRMSDEKKTDQVVYRKGQVGDWKNHFTVAQSEMFDSVYAEQMKDFDFQYRYSL